MNLITKRVPYYVLALAMAVPAVLIGLEIPWWLSLSTPEIVYESDFRVFYTPAYMLRTGDARQLYDFATIRRVQAQQIANDNAAVPFLHPAVEAALFIPFTYLPYRSAYLIWVAFNLGILTAIYWLLREHLCSLLQLGPRWILPALLLGFMPSAFSIFAGQDSLLLLLIFVAAFRSIKANELRAGALLGLGVFRFQVLLPIVLLFLFWRHVRFLCGWISSAAAIFGLSAAITGLEAQRQYFAVLQEMGRFSDWLLVRRMPNLRAFFSSVGLGTAPLVVVSAAAVLLALVVGRKRTGEQKLLLGISISCIVTYYLFLHDICIMTLPLLVTMHDSARRLQWMRLGGLSAVFASYSVLWFLPNHFYVAVFSTIAAFFLQITHGVPLNYRAAKALREDPAEVGRA
jgi:hypothetical protein